MLPESLQQVAMFSSLTQTPIPLGMTAIMPVAVNSGGGYFLQSFAVPINNNAGALTDLSPAQEPEPSYVTLPPASTSLFALAKRNVTLCLYMHGHLRSGSERPRVANVTVVPQFPRISFEWQTVSDDVNADEVTVSVKVNNSGDGRGLVAYVLPTIARAGQLPLGLAQFECRTLAPSAHTTADELSQSVIALEKRALELAKRRQEIGAAAVLANGNSSSSLSAALSSASALGSVQTDEDEDDEDADANDDSLQSHQKYPQLPRYMTVHPRTSLQVDFKLKPRPWASLTAAERSELQRLEGAGDGDLIVTVPVVFLTDEPTVLCPSGRRQVTLRVLRAASKGVDMYAHNSSSASASASSSSISLSGNSGESEAQRRVRLAGVVFSNTETKDKSEKLVGENAVLGAVEIASISSSLANTAVDVFTRAAAATLSSEANAATAATASKRRDNAQARDKNKSKSNATLGEEEEEEGENESKDDDDDDDDIDDDGDDSNSGRSSDVTGAPSSKAGNNRLTQALVTSALSATTTEAAPFTTLTPGANMVSVIDGLTREAIVAARSNKIRHHYPAVIAAKTWRMPLDRASQRVAAAGALVCSLCHEPSEAGQPGLHCRAQVDVAGKKSHFLCALCAEDYVRHQLSDLLDTKSFDKCLMSAKLDTTLYCVCCTNADKYVTYSYSTALNRTNLFLLTV